MLDAQTSAQGEIMKRGHVSGGISDIRIARAQGRIHNNAVLHLQAGLLGQFDVRRNADARHHAIGHKLPLALGVANLQNGPAAARHTLVSFPRMRNACRQFWAITIDCRD